MSEEAKELAITMGYDAMRICLGHKPRNHTVEEVTKWMELIATRPASPALDRLKEEIDSWPHAPRCASHYPSHGPEKPCTCFKSRALRSIEELKQ